MWNLNVPVPPASCWKSECMNAFLRAYINGPRKRAHLISSHVYLRVCAGGLVLFGHVFRLQYHHAVDIF